jgi:hypothetical protein
MAWVKLLFGCLFTLCAWDLSSAGINTLIWVDNSTNEESFVVERKTGQCRAIGAFYEIGATFSNTITYVDPVPDGVAFCYKVKARNTYGDSGYSNAAENALFAGMPVVTQWGAPTDIPVIGDFDGDRKNDIAVWRPSEGIWYIIMSSDGRVVTRQWGTSGDIPIPGDYDDDGKTDIAVWRPSEGNWYILGSATNPL